MGVHVGTWAFLISCAIIVIGALVNSGRRELLEDVDDHG